MRKNHFVLIMAGGEGERFWPYSTPTFPKQFLSLFENTSMIEKTYKRMKKLVPREHIYISTNKRFLNITKQFLPEIPEQNIILESEKRNTFPALVLFLALLKKQNINGSIIMVAADHIIKNEQVFIQQCQNAFTIADNSSQIITFGIVPERIETNYGYLHPKKTEILNNIKTYSNVQFVEKPDYEKAKKFYENGNYYWNSGIFTFHINTLFDEISKIVPDDFKNIEKFLNDKIDKEKLFYSLTKNSIDYVIMEQSNSIVMLKSSFIWDDIGNWDALLRFSNGVYIKGNIEHQYIKNSVLLVENLNLEIKTDIENFIFVEKDENILISSIEGLKYIKQGLKEMRAKNLRIHQISSTNIKMDNIPYKTLILGIKNLNINYVKPNRIELFLG